LTKSISFFHQTSIFTGLCLITISFAAFPDIDNSLISSANIEFTNPSYESYGQGNERLVLKSRQGSINFDNKNITLNGDVEGEFTLDGKTYSLKAESLSRDLLGKSISSEGKSEFLIESVEILSSSMEITQTPQEGIKILFTDASLDEISSKSRIKKGKANKIEFFSAKDLILMQGDAEFFEDNMKIISDEIHYDLNEDRILQSVNAKIINNL